MTRLETLRATSAELGFVREIVTTPAEFDCPHHQVPVIVNAVETIGGWQAVHVCPKFDGTCRYDPDAHPSQIEPLETDADAATGAEPRDTGAF